MQVRVGSATDILSRASLPKPGGDGWAHMLADDLWSRAKAWAAANGHQYSWCNVEGVAPL